MLRSNKERKVPFHFDSKHRLRSKVPLGSKGSLRSMDLLRSMFLLRSNKTQTLMYPVVS